jgi:hypothetical protein
MNVHAYAMQCSYGAKHLRCYKKALRSSFCLQFFPIYEVVKLCLEILSFKQQKNL